MPEAVDVGSLLASKRPLRAERAGIMSALPAGDRGARYDRRAAAYDRLIGSTLYNRVAWGTDVRRYEAFAAEALGAGEGPLLDVGCGTAVFTAAAYRRANRPLVLVDRSIAMLARAGERLEGAPAAFVQADVMDLPFRPARFATVACFGLLHLLDHPWAALAALRDQLEPHGRIFVSMLVADRLVGRTYLAALQRAGEVGAPRRAAELERVARTVFGDSVSVSRTGSMAWLRATGEASGAR